MTTTATQMYGGHHSMSGLYIGICPLDKNYRAVRQGRFNYSSQMHHYKVKSTGTFEGAFIFSNASSTRLKLDENLESSADATVIEVCNNRCVILLGQNV
jgi:hypothetical protein